MNSAFGAWHPVIQRCVAVFVHVFPIELHVEQKNVGQLNPFLWPDRSVRGMDS